MSEQVPAGEYLRSSALAAGEGKKASQRENKGSFFWNLRGWTWGMHFIWAGGGDGWTMVPGQAEDKTRTPARQEEIDDKAKTGRRLDEDWTKAGTMKKTKKSSMATAGYAVMPPMG
ncbi:hypothetical protein H112_00735 [Trichophyton rubrum D6]|uniref:Uncharacterized protein n=3 Tax=Trichophyton TaxID=5550 RepID=F2SZ77_TRIRC|nr:uncharacterized protein TERG_07847 [Trichophyton rubrum CBS 118892]EZF27222.1 hypothetical protein H100_00734 [Trichophyton rubrum MR850]EZF46228.1 hypothetical protein H102_00724 [Trichophyton rubrum CBS 100081]EZF56995.1 hypothetical protein H103_00730 [Trichophyton rubrum CBS 288.86]EZF67558.1 hypothetical protein H104_00717 [Trichophyton rubrum CBS 289.86]EZF78095.1 hypothetical protein H105_00728 [Trichophyton soudanense CBS 452.61]EZF88751.1 hypothetical protein H110_00734 [Trichophy